ncbi:hypothetical protein HELRODRAFT_92382, partial [Helobdella robusta]|uniref:EGF-like domain-containing protein n=1 Tax=Helobdella robusta TaxID=6412 RepID=T1G8F4_HELRO
ADVDECLTDENNCTKNASTCNNTLGSFECLCRPGYQRISTFVCAQVTQPLPSSNGICSVYR